MSAEDISCRQVSKLYAQGDAEVHALEAVALTIDAGSFVSLFGPSGSGKTTLLNIIGGLDVPTTGEVRIGTLSLGSLSRGERAALRLNKIGFIFQAYNLIPVLSAAENVEFVMQLQGIPAGERRERSVAILNEVGLGALTKRRPGELSGGQQQRVAVARAIVANPSIILADEPTANLDSKTAGGLLELMRRLNEERKTTFIFSTHDSLVMQFAKRLIGLHDGKIVSDTRK